MLLQQRRFNPQTASMRSRLMRYQYINWIVGLTVWGGVSWDRHKPMSCRETARTKRGETACWEREGRHHWERRKFGQQNKTDLMRKEEPERLLMYWRSWEVQRSGGSSIIILITTPEQNHISKDLRVESPASVLKFSDSRNFNQMNLSFIHWVTKFCWVPTSHSSESGVKK